jgi:hypothetical protein
MRVDPDGLNDYFTENGKYLGSDISKDDNVRIMSEKTWNSIQQVDDEGELFVDDKVGMDKNVSKKASESDLSDQATLGIIKHYSNTGSEMEIDNSLSGLQFNVSDNANTGELHFKGIKVGAKNLKNSGFIDNANNIKSMLIHEEKHESDYNTLGRQGYLNIPRAEREIRAYTVQVNHESWGKSTKRFRESVQSAAMNRYKFDITKFISK